MGQRQPHEALKFVHKNHAMLSLIPMSVSANANVTIRLSMDTLFSMNVHNVGFVERSLFCLKVIVKQNSTCQRDGMVYITDSKSVEGNKSSWEFDSPRWH